MDRRRFIGMTAVALHTLGKAETRSLTGADGMKEMNAAEWRAARRFAMNRFGRIAFVDQGKGDAAMFLHGFPLSSYQWRGAVARLSGERRCIAPDFLGLGHTEAAPGQGFAPEDQAAMVLALMDALGIGKADLVASDSGGAVAQVIVARYPDRVRTLLLTNCDTEIDSPPAALLPVIELARQGTYADAWLAPWLADRRVARSAEGLGGLCYADPAHPTDDALEDYLAPVLASPVRKAQLHAYTVALARNPLAGLETVLRRSSIPTRIVWGTADPIFSKDSPDYLARTVGASRGVRRLEGRKLFWPEELPDVVAEEARRLWQRA